MAQSICLCFLALAVPARAENPEALGLAAEQEGRIKEALAFYLQALQALPDPPPTDRDVLLREGIIRIALTLKPPVPEDAIRRATWGVLAFKEAQDPQGFEKAAEEFREALRLAPWYAPAIFNLALVQEKLERYAEAQANLRLYLLAAPQAPNVDQARGKLYEIEYRLKQRADRPRAYGAVEDKEAGTVYFFRRWDAGDSTIYTIYRDNVPLADISKGSYFGVQVAAGQHTFSSRLGDQLAWRTTIDVQRGAEYCVDSYIGRLHAKNDTKNVMKQLELVPLEKERLRDSGAFTPLP